MIPNVWETYMRPFRVVGNLYFVGTLGISSHLIDTGEGLVMLDTGYAETLYLVMDSIREMGFQPRDIKWIIHSHGHIDHMAGTRALVELTGAKTYMSVQDADCAAGRRDLSFAKEMGMQFTETFEPDVLIHDGDVLEFGNTKIKCVHTPGHTEGTMSFFFDVVHNGRTVRVGTHGGAGMNSMEREYLEANGLPLSLRDDFRAALHKIREEHVDVFIGNHQHQSKSVERSARIFAGDPDAFIDEAAWGEYLDLTEAQLDAMLAEEAARLNKG